jgi:rhodanese-related sulfurtransferase
VDPKPVVREDVQHLVAAGAQLVEVLPVTYDEEHLPGGIHLPLKSRTREVAERRLDRGRPVIVYCWGQVVRHAPAGRVSARSARLHRGLRLCRW